MGTRSEVPYLTRVSGSFGSDLQSWSLYVMCKQRIEEASRLNVPLTSARLVRSLRMDRSVACRAPLLFP